MDEPLREGGDKVGSGIMSDGRGVTGYCSSSSYDSFSRAMSLTNFIPHRFIVVHFNLKQ